MEKVHFHRLKDGMLLANIGSQWGVSHMEAGRSSVIIIMELITAVVSATLIAGEHMDTMEMIGGALILVAYGIYEFIRDPTINALERVGVLALILGAVLLFLTVLIERMNALKTDKYKDVEK